MNTAPFKEQMETLLSKRAFSDNFVLPDYEKLNVKNISSMIGKIYGIESLPPSVFPNDYIDDFSGVEKVILVILDGLGYKRFLTHLSNDAGTFSDLAEKGVLRPLTTVFPSTTSTVLTSIFTGLSPAEHNIIGYHMFSKQYGLVFDTLDMKPVYGYSREADLAKDFSRKVWPWMPKLAERGISTIVATKGSIAGSGLSRVIHRNQDIIPYSLHSDMLVQCGKVLEQQSQTLLVMYYSGIDTLAHRYGPYSEEVTFELNSLECNFKNFFEKLSEKTKRQTMLIITADHGIADVRKTYFLKDLPDVNSRLMLPPIGDSRATFLFSKPGQSNALAESFRKNVAGFKLFPSGELIEKGAFGQTSNPDQLQQNTGDFTALSTGQNALQYPFYDDDRSREMLGSHGGMTAEEMIVPFLSVRLSNL